MLPSLLAWPWLSGTCAPRSPSQRGGGILMPAARKTRATQRGRPSGRRRRNRTGFVAIPFEDDISLATLAHNTVISSDVMTLGEDLFCISVDALWSKSDGTAGEGPIHVGFAHGDLTVTEIQEALSANLTDPDDIIARERARRPVRKSASFPQIAADEVVASGLPIRTKLRFSLGDGHPLRTWAYNRSGATLTTGVNIRVSGTLYGRWQR